MLQSADVPRFGWTLVHSLWESAAVAALLAIALFILRRQSSQSRYLASCTAMGLLLVLPIGTFLILKPASLPTIPPISFAAHSAPAGKGTDRSAKPDDLQQVAGATPHLERVTPEMKEPSKDSPTVASSPATIRARVRAQDILPWLVVIWAVGVAAMSLWNLAGWIALQRLRSSGTKPTSREIQEQLTQLCTRLGVRRAVRILESARVRSPLMIGVFKPIILLPASIICELPAAQLESILSHELAHIRRHDYLVNLIQSVIETLLFYHPATWWVSRRIRIERENCCDDIALALCNDRAVYATALARIAVVRAPALALAAQGGMLLGRIRRVLGLPEIESRRSAGWAVGIFGLATTLIFVAMLAMPVRTKAQQVPATQPGSSMDLLVVEASTQVPLADAKVTWRRGNKAETTHTDAAGHAKVEYDAMTTTVSVYPKSAELVPTGVRFRTMANPVPMPATSTIPVEHGTTIGGQVVDEDNKPIAGATVYVQVFQPDRETKSRFAVTTFDVPVTTNPEGRWKYDAAPKDPIQVSVRLTHPDFASDENHLNDHMPSVVEFRAGSAVSVMRKGLSVSGRVEDEQGRPVRGAHVTIGTVHDIYPAQTTSAADGNFVLPHCRPSASSALVASAAGFAPQDAHFNLASNRTDVQITLKPAKTFKFRVMDASGKAIPDASIQVRGWHGSDTLLHWNAITDAEGHVMWQDGPADVVSFSVSKSGYLGLQFQHAATDVEQQLVLYPGVKVSGTVVDDETGKPLQKFQIVKGWASTGRPGLFWERGRSDPTRAFQDGRFSYTESTSRDGYGLRVEAEGYLPVESKIFHKEDGDFSMEVRMKKAAAITSKLVSSDGNALADADVLIANSSSQIMITDGKVTRQTMAARTKTDSGGHFSLSAQPGQYWIVVVHENGFANLLPGELKDRLVIPPWGRVEGTAKVGSKPAEHQKIGARNRFNPRSDSERLMIDDHATVDAQGHFVLSHVPTGKVDIGIEVILNKTEYTMAIGMLQAQHLDLVAGHSAQLSFGGTGRPVIGHVVTPPELVSKFDWVAATGRIMTKLDPPKRVLPANWKSLDAASRAKLNDEWNQSPEGKSYAAASAGSHYFPIDIRKDGTFRVEDVPAGVYVTTITINARPIGDALFATKTLASGSQEFTITPMAGGRSDEPLDIGAIGVTERPSIKVGDVAPDFQAKTVDGKPIKLSDYHGKVLLVDFWATWCGPCVEEIPSLKAAHEAFKTNPNFQMLSLSVDDQPGAPRDFAKAQKLEWTQGFLGEWSKSSVPGQWGVQGIPAVFLVSPDGKILATDLRGERIEDEIRTVLGPANR